MKQFHDFGCGSAESVRQQFGKIAVFQKTTQAFGGQHISKRWKGGFVPFDNICA
jgi:hypothetical protein